MTVAISKSSLDGDYTLDNPLLFEEALCDQCGQEDLGSFAVIAGASHEGRPKLTMARMVHGHNISPAEHELLLRMAMRDASRGEFIAINKLTGEETIVPFEEHLKIVGLSEEEWLQAMEDAVSEFFTTGHDVERIE